MYINKMKFIKTCVIIWFIGLTLNACEGGSSNTNTKPAITEVTAITIDNAGIVPLIHNNPTSSVIYIHNNTDHTITNINYVVEHNSILNKNNTGLISNNNSFINSDSVIKCAQISAYSSCALAFTTPVMLDNENQGSTTIAANYIDNGKSQSFSQIINYANISIESQNGIQIMSGGDDIISHGNENGYITLYVYATGINQHFLINSLDINNPNSKIVNNNIMDNLMSSGSIEAIEVAGQTNNKNELYDVMLSLQSIDELNNTPYEAQIKLSIMASPITPWIAMGLTSIYDSYTNGTGPYTVSISNPNNSTINGLYAIATGGVTIIDNTCSSGLAPNASCNFKYNIPKYSNTGILTVSGIINGSIISNRESIIWYNSNNAPSLRVNVINNPVVFLGATSGASAPIDLTNLGGLDLESIDLSVANTVSGFASAKLNPGSNCIGLNLVSKTGTCTYTVQVSDNQQESGIIILYQKGKYRVNESTMRDYSRAITLNYLSSPNRPLLTINTLNEMTIIGNGIAESIQNVTITNNSTTLPEYIGDISPNYIGMPINLSIPDASNCANKILESQASCNVTLHLGPQLNTSGAMISDKAFVTLTYSGGTAKLITTKSNSISAIVNSQ